MTGFQDYIPRLHSKTSFLGILTSRSWNAKSQILFYGNPGLWSNFLPSSSSFRILKLFTCSHGFPSSWFSHVCKHEIEQTKPLLAPPTSLSRNYHQTTLEISWADCALICCLFSRYHAFPSLHEDLKTLRTWSFFQFSEDKIYPKFATCNTIFVLHIRL